MGSSKGNGVLTEKQRDLITIVGFFLSLGVVVSFAVLVTTWKVNIENDVNNHDDRIVKIEEKQEDYDSFVLDVYVKLARIEEGIIFMMDRLDEESGEE